VSFRSPLAKKPKFPGERKQLRGHSGHKLHLRVVFTSISGKIRLKATLKTENQREHRNVEGYARGMLFVSRSTMRVRAVFLVGFMGHQVRAPWGRNSAQAPSLGLC